MTVSRDADAWPPTIADPAGTTHPDADDTPPDFEGQGKANDIQPGLAGKSGAKFTERPFKGAAADDPAIHGGGGGYGGATGPSGG